MSVSAKGFSVVSPVSVEEPGGVVPALVTAAASFATRTMAAACGLCGD